MSNDHDIIVTLEELENIYSVYNPYHPRNETTGYLEVMAVIKNRIENLKRELNHVS